MNFDHLDIATLRARGGKKWSNYGDDVLPAWVADMDFPIAEPIRQAVIRVLELNDLGYCGKPPEDPVGDIFAERVHRRFNWQVNAQLIEGLVDVVQGIYIALQVYSEPGDGVIVLTPSYPPFLHAVAETGRTLVAHTLEPGVADAGGGWEIDFQRLESSIDSRTKVLLLCSPHNPSGRVWWRDELLQLGELALKYDLIVISDEIHADLVFDGRQHIPFASLSPELEARTVTFTSATKAFTIAGLRFALGIFGSSELQQRFNSVPRHIRGGLNVMGVEATKAAWLEGQPWLDAVLVYLQSNRDLVSEFLAARLPDIVYLPPQSTYLAWLDCRKLDLPEAPYAYFLKHAKVAFSDGATFGDEGLGCVRLNFATSEAILSEILERTAHVL